MCTVTFIPFKDKIFITSNRDEKHARADALPPEKYFFQTGKIIYPKDGEAGGSWIAAHENGNAMVLLNGGFEPHEPTPPYRKSRGIIFLEIINSHFPKGEFVKTDLNNIEPFTIIIFESNGLFECRWNGKQKAVKELNKSIPHIWSSVTLYEKSVIKKREQWFEKWWHQQKEFSADSILNFHQFTGDGDIQNDLLMNRNNILYTVSITNIEISKHQSTVHYLDLKNKSKYTQELIFSHAALLKNELA